MKLNNAAKSFLFSLLIIDTTLFGASLQLWQFYVACVLCCLMQYDGCYIESACVFNEAFRPDHVPTYCIYIYIYLHIHVYQRVSSLCCIVIFGVYYLVPLVFFRCRVISPSLTSLVTFSQLSIR